MFAADPRKTRIPVSRENQFLVAGKIYFRYAQRLHTSIIILHLKRKKLKAMADNEHQPFYCNLWIAPDLNDNLKTSLSTPSKKYFQVRTKNAHLPLIFAPQTKKN
jgi:hypothetical protein